MHKKIEKGPFEQQNGLPGYPDNRHEHLDCKNIQPPPCIRFDTAFRGRPHREPQGDIS